MLMSFAQFSTFAPRTRRKKFKRAKNKIESSWECFFLSLGLLNRSKLPYGQAYKDGISTIKNICL